MEWDGNCKKANSFKVERDSDSRQDNIMIGGEEPVIKKAAKRASQRSAKRTTSATPTPEAPAKTGDSSDDCNSDKEEDPAAKAALAKAAPAAAAAAGEDSIDGEETRPTTKESTLQPSLLRKVPMRILLTPMMRKLQSLLQ